MRARPIVTLMTALMVGTGLASCASLPGGGDEPAPGDGPDGPRSTEPAVTADPVDPVDLVNLWRVSGADGEAPDTWIRLDAGAYDLWRECGYVSGHWTATADGLFVAASPESTSGPCGEPWPIIDWLTAARAIEQTDEGWTLLAADGTPVASLTVDGAPTPHPDALESYAQPPEVTPEVRAWFTEPGPLPAGLAPPTREHLLGRWVPESGAAESDSHLLVDEDGTYSASDGCNGSGGAWALGGAGRVLATSGLSTAIGCDGQPVGMWFASAVRAGLDGDVLVLLDRDGSELGRLTRG